MENTNTTYNDSQYHEYHMSPVPKPRYLLKARRLFPGGYDPTLYYMVFLWEKGLPLYIGVLMDGQFLSKHDFSL